MIPFLKRTTKSRTGGFGRIGSCTLVFFSLTLLTGCGSGGGRGTMQMGGAIQGTALNLSRTVTTLAGTANLKGSTDGTGAAARFDNPCQITTDGTTLYVADRSNHAIRKIVIATSEVTTLAGTAGQSGSTDGTGAAARFNAPEGITTDGTSLYVADSWNNTIRKIDIVTGEVTTLAGTAGQSGSMDGTGAAARFYLPEGITTDGMNLYVADSGNDTIRKIDIVTGDVTTLAGTAGDPGFMDTDEPPGTRQPKFTNPIGITTDGTSLYAADTWNDTIRKVVIATGDVTTPAGLATDPGSADGTGNAVRFNMPWGVTTDGTNLYVADRFNNTIRKIR